MTIGIDQSWVTAIRSWAASEELIEEVYTFGSRVKGTARPDSDLDLAVRVAGADEGERLANAIFLMSRWKALLAAALPVPVDLQRMAPDDEVVWPAVQEHGRLIYRAARAI